MRGRPIRAPASRLECPPHHYIIGRASKSTVQHRTPQHRPYPSVTLMIKSDAVRSSTFSLCKLAICRGGEPQVAPSHIPGAAITFLAIRAATNCSSGHLKSPEYQRPLDRWRQKFSIMTFSSLSSSSSSTHYRRADSDDTRLLLTCDRKSAATYLAEAPERYLAVRCCERDKIVWIYEESGEFRLRDL